VDKLLPVGVGNTDDLEHTLSKRPRRNHSPTLKAKVALAAIQGDKTLAELAQEFDIHPNQISDWRSQLLVGCRKSFDRWKTANRMRIAAREASGARPAPVRTYASIY
jgi:transposase-like protein